MKILVHGASGRMGKMLIKIIEEGYNNSSLAGAVGRNINDFNGEADCIIDFSNHTTTESLVTYAVKEKLPLVIATTGHTKDELRIINNASKEIPIFMSANMSLGIALLVELAKKAVLTMPDADIEIIEKHHNRKLDSPSGTAFMLAKEIKKVKPDLVFNLGRSGDKKREKNEMGIHAIRYGNVVGDHEVIIGTDTQTISLKHEAHDRALFAEGAILAAQFLLKQEPGLYSMHDMIG